MTQYVFTIRLDRRTMKALALLARIEQRSKADTLRRLIQREAMRALSAASVADGPTRE